MKTMGLLAAIKDFFGLKPGQTSVEFGEEWKALNEDDREYFRFHLTNAGYNITTTVATKEAATAGVKQAA